MNKFDRVISTLILLQTKKVIKAATISDRFGISLRTVYRDISTLKNAGIPIIGDPGVGYSIMEGYRLPPIMFNEEEASALLTAEKFIGTIADHTIQQHYSNAMTKIKATLRSTDKQSLAVLDDSIAFSSYKHWENKAYLQDLFKSIASKLLIYIQYQKADGTPSERKLEPIGCYHHNNWYLVAFCQLKNDYRTFKMNRITQLQLLDQSFEDRHISLQTYIDRQNEAWKAQQQFISMEILFNKSILQYAESRKYYFGFVEQIDQGEAVYMKFLNSSIEIVARWLIQFSNQATVISPLALKDRLKELTKELYEHYH
ncbi:helix-turn-helix transcriptional regulator [Aureispira anguillae]|uniref:YafY family transcriptional regulator n=1 Tax=Aureispira anguillae TaxID=2864201 RepID=A0A915VK46_9BACT|nr:YafY family protein [Aureispira anguillae]BDS09498.1 YafY family transcriptional regulator [Aureispira anguillae]